MKAAFFAEVNKVELRDVAEPELKNPDEVKVRIMNTGICASDVLGLQGLHPTRKPPVVSGHEAAGVVVEVGPEVHDHKPGDRVVIEPQYGCGVCHACQQGRYNVCQNKTVLGTAKWSGAFAEYVTTPQRTLIRLPDNISYELGALLEPLAVGMHAAKVSGIEPSGTAVIIGSGPIGMACMLGCKYLGVSKTIMIDIQDYSLDIARELGADVLINSREEDPVVRVMSETASLGADVVFIAVGTQTAINDSIAMSKIGACIMAIAHFGAIPPAFDFAKFRYKELTMKGTVMYTKADYEDCIDAINSDMIKPLPMITKVFPIEQCGKAFDLAMNRNENFVKLLFSF